MLLRYLVRLRLLAQVLAPRPSVLDRRPRVFASRLPSFCLPKLEPTLLNFRAPAFIPTSSQKLESISLKSALKTRRYTDFLAKKPPYLRVLRAPKCKEPAATITGCSRLAYQSPWATSRIAASVSSAATRLDGAHGHRAGAQSEHHQRQAEHGRAGLAQRSGRLLDGALSDSAAAVAAVRRLVGGA